MKSIIVDLDGTLSDCSHRQHLAVAKDWDGFNELCMLDIPNRDVKEFIALASLDLNIDVIICTARSEKYRQDTMLWLENHRIDIDTILMRPANDFTRSEELKFKLLEEHFGSKVEVLMQVLFVLDDREKVVEAMRNYGLPCWQVRPGGY